MSRFFRSSRAKDDSSNFKEDSELSADIVFDRDPPLYILHPTAKRPGSQAPKTTSVSGHFLLDVKTTQHVIAIVSKLVPTYSFKHHKQQDDGTCPSLTCQIMDNECTLAPGKARLPFAFEVPADFWGCASLTTNPVEAAEYTSLDKSVLTQDATRVRFIQWYAWEIHIIRRSQTGISSISPSIASMEPELVVVHVPPRQDVQRAIDLPGEWKNLYHLRHFALVPTLANPGELPPPLEVAVESFTPQLGPMRMVISSRSLSVGALLNFQVELLAIPLRYRLISIRGYVEQITRWKSLRKKGPPFECNYGIRFMTLESKDFVQARSEANDPANADPTHALSVQTWVDLPDDRFLNPSTASETLSPMSCEHIFVFRFDVLDTIEREKVLVEVKRPVFLESCMLLPELFNLPRYGSDPLPMKSFQPCRPHARFACACGFSVELLHEREKEEENVMVDVPELDTKKP